MRILTKIVIERIQQSRKETKSNGDRLGSQRSRKLIESDLKRCDSLPKRSRRLCEHLVTRGEVRRELCGLTEFRHACGEIARYRLLVDRATPRGRKTLPGDGEHKLANLREQDDTGRLAQPRKELLDELGARRRRRRAR